MECSCLLLQKLFPVDVRVRSILGGSKMGKSVSIFLQPLPARIHLIQFAACKLQIFRIVILLGILHEVMSGSLRKFFIDLRAWTAMFPVSSVRSCCSQEILGLRLYTAHNFWSAFEGVRPKLVGRDAAFVVLCSCASGSWRRLSGNFLSRAFIPGRIR